MRDLRRMSVTPPVKRQQRVLRQENSRLTAESEGGEKNAEQRTSLETRGRRGEMRADDSGDAGGGGKAGGS